MTPVRRFKDFLRRLFGLETHAQMLARKRQTRWRRVYTGGRNQMAYGKYGQTHKGLK